MRPELRDLPSVHAVLELEEMETARERFGLSRVSVQVSAVISQLRERIAGGDPVTRKEILPRQVAGRALRALEQLAEPRLIQVVNASGVVIHTNLGRSVLSREARERVLQVASSYSNLEFDLARGKRGSRQDLVAGLLRHLTGAEDAAVVTNNAAAVLLALRVLAKGREVVVSRGQLVEIGGSFRIPDVMAESGARLVEVGTTNRTHLADYEGAIGPDTALIMTVHPSNYRVVGFTSQVETSRLVDLGRRRGVPVIMDLGSGLLEPVPGVDEPLVAEVLDQGVDMVTFSGDKLLGGPQAGIMVGRKDIISQLRRHPLMRALRPDKLILAALEGTLSLYLRPGRALRDIPTLEMIGRAEGDLRRAAESLRDRIADLVPSDWQVTVETGPSRVGGGAAPEQDLDSYRVAIEAGGQEQHLADRLRQNDPPVVVRLGDGRLLLDPRTLQEGQEDIVVEALSKVI